MIAPKKMPSATHINDLPNDILSRILWRCEENTSWLSDSDALWSRHLLWPKPQYLRPILIDEDSNPEEETTLIPTPSAVPSAARIFLLSSVCRRWRALAKRDVSTLLVERDRVISLRELSHAVARFPNLTHLHLCDGSVETLDDNFLSHLASSWRLSALKTLVLERLPLSSLPDSLCQLSALETFFLPWCEPIHELPAGFCCLTALKTLCLGRVTLPVDIGRLCNLQTLLVRESFQQRQLPSSLTEITSLTRLELDLCHVEALPEGVGELSNLRELHVSSCSHLMAVPALVTCLTGLETLKLSGCRELASVPTRLDGLTRLKRLEVTSCDALKHPPQVLLASLETLSWGSYSHAMALPDLSRLTGLRTLCLDRVAVACGKTVSRSLSHLEHLMLSLADDAEELPFALTFLSRLRTLIVHGVGNVQRLPPDTGTALPQLRTLKLKCADELRELPASVTALENLTSLEVHRAPQLASLPDGIGALSKLRQLQLILCEHFWDALSHQP